jgi:hypothetical protein
MTDVAANANAGTTVRASVSESAHDLDTCCFLSSSVPDPGHRIVRFADVLRSEGYGGFVCGTDERKDAGARHASART